ncbi:MAG: DUF1841 family protein [Gammaproteobacteria bacterium]|nr:DUF1841 family protein [Gammaproteobacteria bacterium]
MIINNREQSRQIFYQSWQKHLSNIPMEPMESVIVSVIQIHPEYHSALKDQESISIDPNKYDDQHNPFLHMGLHIALLEQLATDRPSGMTSLYESMLTKYADEHQLQHIIMNCLEESLWNAQRSGSIPDEQAYMESLKKLA